MGKCLYYLTASNGCSFLLFRRLPYKRGIIDASFHFTAGDNDPKKNGADANDRI